MTGISSDTEFTKWGTEVIAGLGVRAFSKGQILGCEPYEKAGNGFSPSLGDSL